jgi:ABC-2 type transport system ATP-binding protein
MTETIVQAKEVSKWYGDVIGLNGFSLDVPRGITGIVGPNGAGKSTFFKLVAGTIRPSAGDIRVLGEGPWQNPALLGRIGFSPDYDFLPADLSGREYLRLGGGLHGMRGAVLAQRIGEVLGTVHMERDADRKLGGYSKGMRQRIKIAGALLHDPQVLFLDEPFSGTDPVVKRDLMDLTKGLNQEHGHDIIVSSHVLHEVERLTYSIALLYKGRAVATGDISEIRGLMNAHPHHIVIEGTRMQELAKELIGMDFTVSVELREDRKGITAMVSKPDAFFDSLPTMLERSGSELERMESTDDDLESVFRYLVRW